MLPKMIAEVDCDKKKEGKKQRMENTTVIIMNICSRAQTRNFTMIGLAITDLLIRLSAFINGIIASYHRFSIDSIFCQISDILKCRR